MLLAMLPMEATAAESSGAATRFPNANIRLQTSAAWIVDGNAGTLFMVFPTTAFNDFGAPNYAIFENRSSAFAVAVASATSTGGATWAILTIQGKGTDANVQLSLRSTKAIPRSDNPNPAAWHTFIASWDGATNSKHMYYDNVNVLVTASSTSPTTATDYSDLSAWYLNYNDLDSTGGTQTFKTFFFDTRYIDLSNPINRAKFVDASGTARDLGTAGERPLGTSPALYFTGNTATFKVNTGTGGDNWVVYVTATPTSGALTSAAGPNP